MKKGDFILIGILLLLGGGIILFQQLNKKPGNQVVITIDGKEYKVLDIDKDQKVKIETKDGHYNILEIKDGKADMTEADCKNQVCVKASAIQNIGESISCLPHGIIVKVTAGK